jgi:hypothetical protein
MAAGRAELKRTDHTTSPGERWPLMRLTDHAIAGKLRKNPSRERNLVSESVHFVTFEEWTKVRSPLVIGTNAGSEPLAFQNWRKFKEAFVPELCGPACKRDPVSGVIGV